MASVYLLMHDIRNKLLESFEHMPFREPVEKGQPATKDGERRHRIPRIYIGDLPPKRSPGEGGEDYPAIIIRSIDGEVRFDPAANTGAEDIVNIGIRCLVYEPGTAEDGTREVLDMVERVKFAMATRDIWGDGMWREILPIKWYVGLDRRLSLYDAGKHEETRYFGGAVQTQFKAYGPTIPPDPKILEII